MPNIAFALKSEISRIARKEVKAEVLALRKSAQGLLTHRKRLGLSAAEVGILMGTSSQTIYNWEQGKSRPQASSLGAIAALRNLWKKQAAAIVASRVGAPEAIGG